MTGEVQGVTMKLAAMALDAYSERQRVLANNIANASVDSYVPMRVSFESQLQPLRDAMNGGANDVTLSRLLKDVRPTLEPVEDPSILGDRQLRLDEQMTTMLQNNVQYQTMLMAMGRSASLLQLAISGQN